MASAVDQLGRNFQTSIELITDKLAQRHAEEEHVPRSDKLHALGGLDFKRKLPMIEDWDPDLNKYDAAFENASRRNMPRKSRAPTSRSNWKSMDLTVVQRP